MVLLAFKTVQEDAQNHRLGHIKVPTPNHQFHRKLHILASLKGKTTLCIVPFTKHINQHLHHTLKHIYLVGFRFLKLVFLYIKWVTHHCNIIFIVNLQQYFSEYMKLFNIPSDNPCLLVMIVYDICRSEHIIQFFLLSSTFYI